MFFGACVRFISSLILQINTIKSTLARVSSEGKAPPIVPAVHSAHAIIPDDRRRETTTTVWPFDPATIFVARRRRAVYDIQERFATREGERERGEGLGKGWWGVGRGTT